MRKRLLTAAVLILSFVSVFAQNNGRERNRFFAPEPLIKGSPDSLAYKADSKKSRFAIATNAVDWLYLGTANANAQYAVSRFITVEAQARFNNWTYNNGADNQFESRQKTFAAGVRYWPWYTYSGLWFGGKAQYQEYNRGGIGTLETEEGDAVGFSAGVGYSLQVTRWFNVDFGLTGWLGGTKYTTYACPHCGRKIDEGNKFFVLPNEAIISAMFIF